MKRWNLQVDSIAQYKKFGGYLAFLVIGHSIGIIYSATTMFSGMDFSMSLSFYALLDVLIVVMRIVPLVMIVLRYKYAPLFYVLRIGIEASIYVVVGLSLGILGEFISSIGSTLIGGALWSVYLYKSIRIKVYLGLLEIKQHDNDIFPAVDAAQNDHPSDSFER